MAKISDGQKVEGKGKRKTIMRRDDCVKRDLERMGGEWRTVAKDRRSWRLSREKGTRER